MKVPVCLRLFASASPVRRLFVAAGAGAALLVTAAFAHAEGGGTAEIKIYLTGKLNRMDNRGARFRENADAYQKLVDASGGDYNRVALEHGSEALALVAKMQGDFKIYHNEGYETIEGITAGTKLMVDFDTYLDAGVPKSEATTDSPASTLVLKDRNGKILTDRNGNLFHYVIEPTLWGTKENFVHRLSPEGAAKVKPVTVLPRADVCVAAANDCAPQARRTPGYRQPGGSPRSTKCDGALVWMTPTLNGYFDDWRDSRYNPAGRRSGRYVAPRAACSTCAASCSASS